MKNSSHIVVTGARQHNLKNVSVKIPRDTLTVFTGLSGSGKSSLAFDTIYAEGQRQYVESLSNYAKQFLGVMEKPDVDQIENLSPAISIDQKSATRNPRSTVGTVTEIYDLLRLLFARVGIPHCVKCTRALHKASAGEILDQVFGWLNAQKVQLGKNGTTVSHSIDVFMPVTPDAHGQYGAALALLKRRRITKLRVNDELVSATDAVFGAAEQVVEAFVGTAFYNPALSKKKEDAPFLLDQRVQVTSLVQKALDLGAVAIVEDSTTKQMRTFYRGFYCEHDATVLSELQPSFFSFNSPRGACEVCQGLGKRLEVEPDLVLPNGNLTLEEGAIRPWSRTTSQSTWYQKVLNQLRDAYKVPLNIPVSQFTPEQRQILLFGKQSPSAGNQPASEFEGVIPNLERRHHETDSDYIRQEIEKYMVQRVCPSCEGQRLRKEVLAVSVAHKNIVDVVTMPLSELKQFFDSVKLSEKDGKIASGILIEMRSRTQFLLEVGLVYLTLDRNASTLAGGEAQRIRLATQLGSSLVGVLYILDEPSIGLHQRDQERLIATLKTLTQHGNSVIVVEHDQATIEAADYIVDFGPRAGDFGGEIVAAGTPAEIRATPGSLTGAYLSGRKSIEIPLHRRPYPDNLLTIRGAREFNLKNITVSIPLGRFVVVSGVSGSGKSTLISEILARALVQHFYRSRVEPGAHDAIEGIENLEKVIEVDQSPIGRTPRSNAATYTGVFTPIRMIYAEQKEAQERGFDAGRFSFNVRGGRCENCRGDGVLKIEMHFLPDVYITCDVCHGRRYNHEALEIFWRAKNIADILDMTVDEACTFFHDQPLIMQKLKTLSAVGLGYLHLGQPATTLSGGEAQRVKLATELARQSSGNTLYILDEPTTGLHFEDIKQLLHVLQQLVDKGNTVLVIEHNLDVIKSADWVIDLGPDGGDAGGKVVGEGTPEQIANPKASAAKALSHTGRFLKPLLVKK